MCIVCITIAPVNKAILFLKDFLSTKFLYLFSIFFSCLVFISVNFHLHLFILCSLHYENFSVLLYYFCPCILVKKVYARMINKTIASICLFMYICYIQGYILCISIIPPPTFEIPLCIKLRRTVRNPSGNSPSPSPHHNMLQNIYPWLYLIWIYLLPTFYPARDLPDQVLCRSINFLFIYIRLGFYHLCSVSDPAFCSVRILFFQYKRIRIIYIFFWFNQFYCIFSCYFCGSVCCFVWCILKIK